jgi:DNA-binding PadR family transcriptional regulator
VLHNSYLGELEHLILLAVARLDREAYGMSIRREIAVRVERDLAIGAVYATLERLEEKGFVSALERPPSPDRDGRARRFFCITRSGERALMTAASVHERMWDGLRLKRIERASR